MEGMDADTLAIINDLTPTDTDILAELDDARNTPCNIADNIDRTPEHTSTRIQILKQMELVRSVGRETVSLYEITSYGTKIVRAHSDFRAAVES